MKPVRRGRANPDLFRERLDAIIDMRHGWVRLAGLMPWSDFDESFGKFFKPTARPAKPTRLMIGLHYLKHVKPMIGHAKNDGRLGRNYLLGTAGDKINAILAAAGHNLRLVLKRLALLFARILETIFGIFAAKNRYTGRYNASARINRYLVETDKFSISIT